MKDKNENILFQLGHVFSDMDRFMDRNGSLGHSLEFQLGHVFSDMDSEFRDLDTNRNTRVSIGPRLFRHG